ncbi:MAG: hypothetical protein F6K30_24820 [Cyanothece sp. SIO2G6]|nr:hypothetical protein [Cyanothece sp. SIO2G6]
MNRHFNAISCINTSLGLHRESVALDQQETQFFEHCRRSPANVPYPRHIPVPAPVFNVQRRGLTYQSAVGHCQCLSLPVMASARLMTGATCPINRPNQACEGATC